jgi:hypothetical protein
MGIAKFLAPALFACALLPVAVPAGDFNCAVVYDEFESLMNKRFLEAPDQFVPTTPGRMSREQFQSVARTGFRLYPGREGLAVGVLVTNQNIHSKFLFHWSEPMEDGSSHVIIDELVKYGRVSDGYAPSRSGPFRLKPGIAVDIDTGEYVRMEGDLLEDAQRGKRDSGDLMYESGPEGGALKSINGAQVQFPLDTLCRQGSA